MRNKIRISTIHSRSIYSLGEEGQDLSDIDKARTLKQKNIDKTLDFLHEAGRQGADIAATHECIDAVGLVPENSEWNLTITEEIPGPISDSLGVIARKYNMNIVANYHEKQGTDIYNTSVLIDRNGRIAGKYRKIHLPPSEKWCVSAGEEYTVLDSDIGKIGFAICYDIVFQEHCRAMALNGADIIFHQTMGWGIDDCSIGESLVRVRAADNCVYLVVSKNIQDVNSKYGKSCIIDNNGYIIAEAGGECEKVVTAEITPDFDNMHRESFNALFSGVDSTRSRLLLERRPSLYRVLTDERPPLRERYADIELHTSPEQMRRIIQKRDKYLDDIKNNRPVEIKYHW